jgi:hypothetical protein
MKKVKCKKDRCLKEINPNVHPGVFFGTPFEYDPNLLGCVFCSGEKRVAVVDDRGEVEHKLLKRIREL